MDELEQLDLEHRWHPFSTWEQAVRVGPIVIVGGEGAYVVDSRGRRYLDGHAALWLMNVGYGREAIVAAAAEQMRRLPWFSSFLFYSNEPAIRLSAKLAELLAPEGMTRFFFAGSGSEANETAIKIARQYWKNVGRGTKVKIISRHYAYHGVTMGATALTGLGPNRRPYEPLLPGVRHIPAPHCFHCALRQTYPQCGLACADSLEELIAFEGADTIAAFIAEPVQGAGGVIIPPPDYLRKVAEICRRHDILFIADEVITGFGRLGEWFGSRYYGVKPDIMTFAKGLTSGYLPLSATAVREEIFATFREGRDLRHGNTYSGHPVACAAALANLRIIEEEGLVDRVRALSPYFGRRLAELGAHPSVVNVASVGLLGRVELALDRFGRRPMPPDAMERIMLRILELGVILRPVGNVITLSPPFVVTEADIDHLVSAIGQALTEIADPLVEADERAVGA